MSHIITIDASPHQLSKLRNGHRVRVKKGTGFNVIVQPDTYHLVSRAFAKNKGIEIALSPSELETNRGLSPEQHAELKEAQPEMAGQGIFGKKFDKVLKKAGIKKLAYRLGDEYKPMAKAGITAGLASGATALGAVQPELVPFLPAGVGALSGLAYDYLDNPNKYQRGFSGIKAKPSRTIAEQAVKAKLNEKLNEQLGTNYDYMNRAGLENAIAQQGLANLSNESFESRLASKRSRIAPTGYGLYAGKGLGERSIMGRGNINSSGYVPPALVSQPMGANFQFQHFFPTQYQGLTKGSGLFA